MGYFISVFFCIMALFLAWDAVDSYSEYTARMAVFERSCSEKGGVTLRGYKDGKGWIGCYRAEEIYNEVEK